MADTTLYDIFKDLGVLLMMCGNADVREFVEQELSYEQEDIVSAA